MEDRHTVRRPTASRRGPIVTNANVPDLRRWAPAGTKLPRRVESRHVRSVPAMRTLPAVDPGTPDHRSATRYLLWLARQQARPIMAGIGFGVVWMVSQALMPAAIGRAIDDGIAARNVHQLELWAGVLLALGLTQAVTGILRHRVVVYNFLAGAYRTVQVTVRHAGDLGATLPNHIDSGEVVSIGTSDLNQIGNGLDVTARGTGAVVAIIAVAVILLSTSVPLGLILVIGVPVLLTVVSLLIRPLHRRQQAYRQEQGALTTRATDIVNGLRVLRGIGGEVEFADRYAAHSQRLRQRGVRVARVESYLEAAQVLLPGIFVVLVTWASARFTLGGRLTVGQLVAFYGYATFLVLPLRTVAEAVDKMTRAHVAAGRVVRVLSIQSDVAA